MKSIKQTVKLLNSIPYFSLRRRIPPRHILNELTRKGVDNAGMGDIVKWKPFELSESDYFAVVQELRRSGMEQVEAEPPSDVNTYDLWQEWCMVNSMGEDGAELAQLLAQQRKLMEEKRSCEKQGDKDAVHRLFLEIIKIDARVSEIMVNMQPE